MRFPTDFVLPPLEPAELNLNGSTLDLSVLVPVTERPADLAGLYWEFVSALRATGYRLEFVFAAGQWSPDAREKVLGLAREGEPVRLLEVGQIMSEAALTRAAGAHCRGRWVLTLPAYYRITAEALPKLLAPLERGADIAVARRWPRRDSWINQLQNRVLHRLLGGLVRGRIHDVACGVRAMRRDLLQELPLYGDFSRFLPLLAMREGYVVEEVAAPQHPRDTGPRIYSPGVYLRRLLDVFGLFFLLRFTEKPLRFFGMFGSVFASGGAVILIILAVQRLLYGQGIAERPLLLLGVLLLVLGVQAVALGLIGEIIVHLQARRTPTYRIRDGDSTDR